ncbi:aromatic amino acid exporter YddG [Phaeovulum vinaykumarii]|uniref:EamA domain-containing membrane protein RarD n=1 Tax=Phaeovulum vinaykumarii TaxID=407234 RepID=A0A1N7KU07_9RHOB|nr:DMT family transporter [Phaeovulum vinaykumarii]SIS65037.1 EamA domain-containing membrane protein RarD [Phaeovulum vinaykumarii]SOC01431.1 EamA domain-containing membrane protein RarD [Phaeovulum vinaykumarii]
MSRNQATLIGFSAVALWALLALMTVGSTPVPPLQLNAMTFALGGLIGLIWVMRTGGLGQLTQVPLRVYAFGTAGLCGYHLLYFTAMRLAPPAEAGLICYLWPLLIVVFSGLLPGETLRAGHVIGAALGFLGAAAIVAGRLGGPDAGALPGYGVALLAAFTWAGYSLISRRLGRVPTAAVAVYCLATAALSLPAHLVFEETLWPEGALGWAAVAGLGLGPVGLAFYTWDLGVKRGDIQLLGTASYAAPLLSTLILVAAGYAKASATLALASILITAGAALAARAGRSVRQA